MENTKIAEYIKKRRKTLRIQQKDLAELSGVSLRTVIKIENSVENPSIDTLNKITKVLGIEILFQIKRQ